ncbi:cation-translocating P-type ATPase [Georgenia sp. TF02-10]|uniref:cation-translocating P-type ATPase n=1 Tax=Georgenia sp. TF02-10 TaxID=2917725 RepID=UPI001FA78367|nr:cation-translocating P-type ATPase [Georgenia sp. TF02-10]UNX54950.1 cation-translocating P-type ATPase [Georgenia sp. TF02-10]
MTDAPRPAPAARPPSATATADPDPSLRDAADVARDLGVDPDTGLTSAEATRRLEADGPNELRSAPPVPLWRKVLGQLQDPLVYLLLLAIVISVAAWAAEGASGLPVDAIVIAAVVILNAVLGLVQESRAADAVAALRTMTQATSTVLRDGELRTVPAAELVRGDVLVLGEGDAVGADARLLTATALRVSEASLTGESAPVTKNPATLPGPAPLGDRLDMLFRGTAVAQGVGRAVVTSTGMATQMGAIAEMLEATEADPSPLQREIAGVSKLLGITVVVIAVVVMVVTALVNDVSSPADLVTVLLLGVSLAVAAVPEGLPAILSVVLAIGVQRMARRNAVVKKLHSVETLGSASVIASDKTGTLTRNEMTIERVVSASGEAEVTGAGYRPDGEVLADGEPLGDGALLTEARLVLAGGALASNAQLAERDGEWEVQGDPTEAAFLVAARKLAPAAAELDRFRRRAEVPFTSERKMMSALEEKVADGGRVLMAKGAPDVLLGRCTRVRVGEEVVPLDDARRTEFLGAVERLSGQALRTLAVAYLPSAETGDRVAGDEVDESVERDLVFVGVAGIIDPPRTEAARAVDEAHRAGVRVMMITGDHPATAQRIAADLGIVEPGARVVTGAELDRLDDAGLRDVTREVSVYARVAPQNKLQIVDALQADGQVVAMTGDGVNDAPALKSADIGVAMGITGTEVTKEAGTMVLGDDNFATIVAAVRQGRVIFDNIKKFLRYLLSSNMGEVFSVFLGVVLAGAIGLAGADDEAVVVPLLATQILWINLVTDSGPALAMGVDPEIDDVMARPPRPVTERIIDRRMWTGVLAIGLVMGVASLLTIDIFLPGGLVAGEDSLEVARTAGFTTLVFAQLFNVFNSRSETTSAFHRLFVNRWLWGAVALAAVLQLAVVEVPFLQVAFGTAPLDLEHWAISLAMASSVLWFDELRKLVWRARHRG